MRVHFTPDIFGRQRIGGVSTYFASIMDEFIRDPSMGVEVVGLPVLSVSEPLVGIRASQRFTPRVPARGRGLHLANSALALRERRQAKVVHGTYYSTRHLRVGNQQIGATTIHDMIPELYPQYFPNGNPHRFKRTHAYEADLVCCVSETSQRDLQAIYPDLPGKVVVTRLGTGFPFTAHGEIVGSTGVPFPYVLFVGSRGGYKAFPLLVEALSRIRASGQDVGLVAVGGGQFSESEIQRFESVRLTPDRVQQVAPTNEELALLYRSALMLSYPSEYEGFGLPLLDALASGCMLVTSDAPALLEVAGGHALVHPRGDAEALAEAIRTVIEMPGAEATHRRQNGTAYAAEFTWRRTAQTTLEGYRAL